MKMVLLCGFSSGLPAGLCATNRCEGMHECSMPSTLTTGNHAVQTVLYGMHSHPEDTRGLYTASSASVTKIGSYDPAGASSAANVNSLGPDSVDAASNQPAASVASNTLTSSIYQSAFSQGNTRCSSGDSYSSVPWQPSLKARNTVPGSSVSTSSTGAVLEDDDLSHKAVQYEQLLDSSKTDVVGPQAVFQRQVKSAWTEQAPGLAEGTDSGAGNTSSLGSAQAGRRKQRRPLHALLRFVSPIVAAIVFSKWHGKCCAQRKAAVGAQNTLDAAAEQAGAGNKDSDNVMGAKKLAVPQGLKAQWFQGCNAVHAHRDWCAVGGASLVSLASG